MLLLSNKCIGVQYSTNTSKSYSSTVGQWVSYKSTFYHCFFQTVHGVQQSREVNAFFLTPPGVPKIMKSHIEVQADKTYEATVGKQKSKTHIITKTNGWNSVMIYKTVQVLVLFFNIQACRRTVIVGYSFWERKTWEFWMFPHGSGRDLPSTWDTLEGKRRH